MVKLDVFLASEQASLDAGACLAQVLAAATGATVFLEGPLGAGKTTITRGILKALGHQGAVKSPTYTLVEPYEQLKPAIYHFDLYRLGDPEELEYMGIRDYFAPNNLCIVEWPAKGMGYLPKADIELQLSPKAASSSDSVPGRQLLLSAGTDTGVAIVNRLKEQPFFRPVSV